jgi:hypothetical protein
LKSPSAAPALAPTGTQKLSPSRSIARSSPRKATRADVAPPAGTRSTTVPPCGSGRPAGGGPGRPLDAGGAGGSGVAVGSGVGVGVGVTVGVAVGVCVRVGVCVGVGVGVWVADAPPTMPQPDIRAAATSDVRTKGAMRRLLRCTGVSI